MNINIQTRATRECLCGKDFSYKVHRFMISQMQLKGLELQVFAIIYSYFACGGSFTASRYYLSDALCCALSSVDRTLAALVDKGYIRRIDYGVRGVEYAVNVERLPENPLHNNLVEMYKEDNKRQKGC